MGNWKDIKLCYTDDSTACVFQPAELDYAELYIGQDFPRDNCTDLSTGAGGDGQEDQASTPNDPPDQEQGTDRRSNTQDDTKDSACLQANSLHAEDAGGGGEYTGVDRDIH
jgi:hypothetical protein